MDVGGPSSQKYHFSDTDSEHAGGASGMKPLLLPKRALPPHRDSVCAARSPLPFSRAWPPRRLDPRRCFQF